MKCHSIIKVTLFNLPFIVGSFKEVSNLISRQLRKGIVVLPCDLHNVAIFNASHKKNRYNHITFCTTDGMPLVWLASHVFPAAKIERVYGPDLLRELLTTRTAENCRHLFFGSTISQIEVLEDKVKNINPRLRDLFFFPPPFGDVSTLLAAAIPEIKATEPDVVWLGIASPKQVYLSYELKKKFPRITVMCVGAAFDFISGSKKVAPKWIQQMGAEWLFRLLSEPARLSERYLVIIPLFLLRVLRQKLLTIVTKKINSV